MSTSALSLAAFRSVVRCRLGPVPPVPSVPWHHAHCDSKMRLPAAMSVDAAVRSSAIEVGGCAAAAIVTSTSDFAC